MDKTERTKGETKSEADGVKITFTSAPTSINNLTKSIDLYEDILPEIPTNIFFLNNEDCLIFIINMIQETRLYFSYLKKCHF